MTPAEPTYAEPIAVLAEEMDRFYGASEVQPHELRLQQIHEAIFSDPPSAYALLAWNNSQLVGLASYSFLWPAAGLTRSLYLKELYVVEAARGRGVGKLLMRSLYQTAAKYHCTRVEWTTDQDNVQAQHFYAELGVPVSNSKLFYRVEDAGFVVQLQCGLSESLGLVLLRAAYILVIKHTFAASARLTSSGFRPVETRYQQHLSRNGEAVAALPDIQESIVVRQ
ncbi:MAG: GNAT family N-acetyltransferase [Streptosporangiaceae bacterium]